MKSKDPDLSRRRKILEGGEGTYEVWEPVQVYRKEDELTDEEVEKMIRRITNRKRG